MTTERLKRCRHCDATFKYYMSGGDCLNPTNNAKYCPECMKVMLVSLEDVPLRVEQIKQRCDVTKKDVEAELKRLDEQKGFTFRRITVPSFDLNNPSNHNTSGLVTIDGKLIYYSWWSEKDKVEIMQLMEKNLETGEVTPWIDI